MTTALSAERINELEAVLGTEQRLQLFMALTTQATEARLTIRQHFDAGEEQPLRREVHRLKGAAQIIGADSLIAALKSVENCQPGEIAAGLIDTIDREIVGLIAAVEKLGRKTSG